MKTKRYRLFFGLGTLATKGRCSLAESDRGGTFSNSGPGPSAMVGWVRIASRSFWYGAGHDAELRTVTCQMHDPRAPDLILAGQAGDIRAGAANPSALDHSRPPPRLRHVPSQQLSTLSAPKGSGFQIVQVVASDRSAALRKVILSARGRLKMAAIKALSREIRAGGLSLARFHLRWWTAIPSGRPASADRLMPQEEPRPS
jgi:hypothetical protein